MARIHPSITHRLGVLFCAAALLLFPMVPAAQETGADSRGAALPEDLKGLAISDTFIPLFAVAVGTIQSVQGRLIVRHGDSLRAYYAAPGNQLYQNDMLYTLEASRGRLQFNTEEIITMGANSRIRVDEVVDDRAAQQKRSIFSMLKGKAMFYAMRLFRYKRVEVEVRTPTAVAGIRGTKFGVEVEKAEIIQSSADPVYFADAAGALPPRRLAQRNPGEGFRTTVYGFDGEVEVTSTAQGSTQTVGAGESVTVGPEGAGEVMATSPDAAQQFSADTDLSAGETGDGGKGRESRAEVPEIGMPAFDPTAIKAAVEASDKSQNLTSQAIQESVPSDIFQEQQFPSDVIP